MPIIDNTAILNITDGTTTIDLLRVREGVAIENWRQAVAQYRGGGTFQESSLADGRRLVDKKFAAIRETMPLKIGNRGTTGTQNTSIETLHRLFAMFEKASNYWTADWQCEPVWLEKRASCEDNIEYATVVTATIPDIDDIYLDRFDTGALVDMVLVIERGQWTATQPTVATAVPISAVETWDSVNMGNVDDSGVREPATSGVYIQNARVPANITHVFTWSAANGFSANLHNGGVPYDLIDDVGVAPQVNDYVMFGIAVLPAPDSGSRSLVFDIGTAQTGLSLTWEINNGGAWVALPAIQDNTGAAQPFDTTGVNSVHWVSVVAGQAVINGVDAWWVRARITAVPGPVVVPTQQNRDIYAIMWPYTEIQSDVIDGNLPSLARIKLILQSQDSGGASGIEDLYFNRAVIGLRSMGRGANFTAMLNSDTRAGINPTGITTAAAGGAAFGGNTYSQTDAAIRWQPAGVSAMADRVVWTLDTTIAPEYYGTFRVFGRFRPFTAGASNIVTQLRIKLGAGGETITNPENVTWSLFDYIVADYGKVTIPGQGALSTVDAMTVELAIQIESLGALNITILDLILMPVDEWAIDTYDIVNDADSPIEEGRYLDIDSIVWPKRPLRSLARIEATDEVTGTYLAVKNGPAILQRENQQRLWCFLMRSETAGSSTWIANIQTAALIEVEKQQRYLGPRGSR